MHEAFVVALLSVALTHAADQTATTVQVQEATNEDVAAAPLDALNIDDLLAEDETGLAAASMTSTQCPAFTWGESEFAKYHNLEANATWLAWAQHHFPRETTNCPQGRTCWAGLYCERGVAPTTYCNYSATELCMRAGDRTDTRCKAVHMVQCPCHSTQGLSATLTAAMENYMQAFGQEWRAQHPQGPDWQFQEACDASQYMSTVAKTVMYQCMQRHCAASHGVTSSTNKQGSDQGFEINIQDESMARLGFGGGTSC